VSMYVCVCVCVVLCCCACSAIGKRTCKYSTKFIGSDVRGRISSACVYACYHIKVVCIVRVHIMLSLSLYTLHTQCIHVYIQSASSSDL